ncbi:MAG: FAD:protein FMN transferase [Clostridia bacterium]|nr:FAD:protein FMN transferase [Clostridia bacterium]
MKKKLFAVVIILALFIGALARYMSEFKSATVFSMDTMITIKTTGNKKNLEYAKQEIERLDKIFNAYDKNSELYEINRFGGKKLSREMAEILNKSIEYSKLTDGNFDITLKNLKDLWDIGAENPKIPAENEIKEALFKTGMNNLEINDGKAVLSGGIQLDLGAVAKGYATDVISGGLKERGVKKFLLDLGGNIYAYSENKPLKIGIQNPFSTRGDTVCVLSISDAAVVSSGFYERNFKVGEKVYHHILDPKTGYPANSGVSQVTIVGKNAAACDAFSTAVAVSGLSLAQELYKNGQDFEYMVVAQNKIYMSKGLYSKLLEVQDGFEVVVQQ